MRNAVLLGGLLLGLSAARLNAGSVATLRDNPEASGKLTLNPSAIHVEGTTPADIDLTDVLAADFAETPFHFEYFSSAGDTASQAPDGWRGTQIGKASIAGSFSYANGTFTLKGEGEALESKEDQCYFAGRPWTGNGEWTARLLAPEGTPPGGTDTEGGLMLRESFDPSSVMFGIGLTGLAERPGQDQAFGWTCLRRKTGDVPDLGGLGSYFPVWFRLTRNGASVGASLSNDGKEWNVIDQDVVKMAEDTWIGLFLAKSGAKPFPVTMDHVSFSPPPCQTQVLPPGVLLRSGSFLAGYFNPLIIDLTQPDADGNFIRIFQNEKPVSIPPSKIAAIIMQPAKRSEIAAKSSQTGLIMKNGDATGIDSGGISGYGVNVSSVALGIVTYNRNEVRACVLHPMHAQSSDYEVRLKDGSSIRATGVSVDNGQIVINEISGITVEAAPEEIAQFRAGPAQVQTLLELPWHMTPPATAPANPDPATNAAPTPTATNPAPNSTPSVQCWQGNNQEQIMVAPEGTSVEFPVPGRFRALALRVALSPDSPPKAEAILRILADGKELLHSPVIVAGNQPRFVEFPLQYPETVTLEVNSFFPGTKVLLIDPVAIKENAAPTP